MRTFNRNSNKVMALASAMLAITFGHSYSWWLSNDSKAKAPHVDAKEVWDLACLKANKHHSSVEPDPTPTTPAPACPMPIVKKSNCVKMARIARLNSLGTSNERVWIKVA